MEVRQELRWIRPEEVLVSLVFQTSELFPVGGLSPLGRKGHSEREEYVIRWADWVQEGPHRQVQEGSSQNADVGPGGAAALGWSGGPAGDSCKGPQQASAFTPPLLFGPPVPLQFSGQQAP